MCPKDLPSQSNDQETVLTSLGDEQNMSSLVTNTAQSITTTIQQRTPEEMKERDEIDKFCQTYTAGSVEEAKQRFATFPVSRQRKIIRKLFFTFVEERKMDKAKEVKEEL